MPSPKLPSVNEPKHRSTRARTDGSSQELVEHLRKKLRAKQRLASSTFRFQAEDLEELNRVFDRLQGDYQGQLSKNDLVRLGVGWLLSDFDQNGDESMLAQVLARL
jgi:hypothetical protein